MHLKRNEITPRIPIPRKGTKYVARATSHHRDSVPVIMAIRDMLGLAKNTKEIKHMIQESALEVNWKTVWDVRDSIKLFNVLKADKEYVLTILPTGRFAFVEDGKSNKRVCKVIGKTALPNKKIQINLHDGTNVLSNEKISVGDSVYLDKAGKIVEVIKFAKGKNAFVTGGKYVGKEGKIENVDGKKVNIKFADGEAVLDNKQLIVR